MSESEKRSKMYYSLCSSYRLLEVLLQGCPDDTLVEEIIRVEKKLLQDFSDYRSDPTWPID